MMVQWNAGRVAGAALLMSAMAAASVAAAEAAEAAGDTRQRALDAIVVTAQAPQDGVAWETDPKLPRQPVPASDGADYLKTIPGFTAIRNGGSNGDPVLRGMFGSRLNLLSNEGSMPGACPSRMDNPMSYVAPETFDRLVVVKGPQTVLWGPGASAGTVRFERDGARFDMPGARVNASALVGSNSRRDALIDASAGLSQGYVRVTGNHSEADDYRAGDGSRVPSRWEKWNADVMLGWTPDADTLLEIGLGRGDGEARYAGRRMDGTMFDRDAQSIRFEKSGFDGALKAIEASAYRNEVDHLMDNYTLREPNPMGPMPMPMASNVDRLTYGGRAAATFDIGRWELTPGVDAQNSRHRRRSAMGRDAYLLLPRTQDADLRQRGAFVEAAYAASASSRWIGGLRLDRASATDHRIAAPGMPPQPTSGETRDETLGSGFLRHEWRRGEGFSAFAGLGQVRRMPDYWELFSPNMGPMGSPNAFAGVRPERTTQLDAGLNFRSQRLDAWVSAYAGRISDYILFTYHTGGMMGTMTRADNVAARIRGAEAGLEYRAIDRLKLGTTVAYARGENRDAGTPLPQMPPLEARMSATWDATNWSVGLLWRVVAAQDRVAPGQGSVVGQDIGESRGFGTLALNASARIGQFWRLSAGIDNLFDRAYSEHLNLAGSADFGFPADPVRIYEPGRNLWLKLDYSY
jgi:iron complex outermembrane receptor protein